MPARTVALAVLAGGLLCLAWSTGCAAPAPATTKPLAFPGGGVRDPAGKVAYVPNKSSGVDAIRLDSGEVLWSSKGSANPLLATEDRLFAWAPVRGKANEITVLVFDTANKGKQLRESRPVKLPDWVSTGVTHGRSFAITAGLRGDNLFVLWQARAWYAGGAAPPPEIEAAARKAADGVARISLEIGSVEMMDRTRATKSGAALPEAIPGEVHDLKQGEHTFVIVDEAAAGPPRFPMQQKRLVKAKDKSGKVVWQREIKAPVHLIPLP